MTFAIAQANVVLSVSCLETIGPAASILDLADSIQLFQISIKKHFSLPEPSFTKRKFPPSKGLGLVISF